MVLRELIQRVQSLYSKGVHSDDTRLSDRHIYSKLLSLRSKLISDKVKKKQKLTQWSYQTLPCVQLTKAFPYECPCLPSVGCEVLKTTIKLPDVLTSYSKHLIQSVTSLDGSIEYSESSWEAQKYKSSSRYTSDKADYYIRDNYLYITHKSGPKVVSVTALFENPISALQYPSYCCEKGDDCEDTSPCKESCWSPLDLEFPIELSLVDVLIDLAVKELIFTFNQGIEDLTNDSKDNITESSK